MSFKNIFWQAATFIIQLTMSLSFIFMAINPLRAKASDLESKNISTSSVSFMASTSSMTSSCPTASSSSIASSNSTANSLNDHNYSVSDGNTKMVAPTREEQETKEWLGIFEQAINEKISNDKIHDMNNAIYEALHCFGQRIDKAEFGYMSRFKVAGFIQELYQIRYKMGNTPEALSKIKELRTRCKQLKEKSFALAGAENDYKKIKVLKINPQNDKYYLNSIKIKYGENSPAYRLIYTHMGNYLLCGKKVFSRFHFGFILGLGSTSYSRTCITPFGEVYSQNGKYVHGALIAFGLSINRDNLSESDVYGTLVNKNTLKFSARNRVDDSGAIIIFGGFGGDIGFSSCTNKNGIFNLFGLMGPKIKVDKIIRSIDKLASDSKVKLP